MGWLRSEEEAEEMIQEMIKKSKGRYVTQGVSFNKNNERHMEMLKLVLMRANSFSGFIKEILAEELYGDGEKKPKKKSDSEEKEVEKINPSNFML